MDWTTQIFEKNGMSRFGQNDEGWSAFTVVSSKYFYNSNCVCARWPVCIVPGIDYPGSDTAESPITVKTNVECSNLCQEEFSCKLWVMKNGDACWLKTSDTITGVPDATVRGAGMKTECYHSWLYT
jgi:hypothetical protein